MNNVFDLSQPLRYPRPMPPQLAICNIFDQDVDRLADFAIANGFSCIDWSIDPDQSESEFLCLMQRLSGFKLRYHCRFFDVDLAFTDYRGEESLALLSRTVEKVARAGGRHMTVHIGLGNPTGAGINEERAIENLRILVDQGNRLGVAVALENLTTPITYDPEVFNRIVNKTGAFVTIDIGHAHAARSYCPQGNHYCEYIVPNRERLLNAHVYHTEVEVGHLPPDTLWDLFLRLDLLYKAQACDWWVIELNKPEEILRTRDILVTYFELSRLAQNAAGREARSLEAA